MSVRINTKPLEALVKGLSAGLRSHVGPVEAMFRQWDLRYLAFARREFKKNSRGGGRWAPLAEATMKARRGARKGYKGRRRFSILYDTGLLFKALNFGAPGNLYQKIKNGIRVGFGGPARHGKDKVTIADIARYHNQGSPKRRLPKRQIIVEPSVSVVRAMGEDAKMMMARLMGRASKLAR